MSSEDSSLNERLIALDPSTPTSGEVKSRRAPSPIDARKAQTLLIVVASLAALSVLMSERPVPTSANSHPAPIRIDLNIATHQELNLLPGIGDKMAIKLLRRRDQIQGFKDWQSIESVPGMGPATVREMQRWCALTPTRSTTDAVFLASRNH